MKNLKRVLSLALASVMLIGMMAVGASAADVSDFSDGESVTHTQAVDVMATLGVITGYPDGTYLPEKVVTRAEMTAIITRILNGGVEPTLGTSTSPLFSDVTGWARPYVEYCANLGIVNGMGDGTFHPNDPVTGAQAAKMLLVAAGYKSDVYGFTGSDWELNVNQIANQKGLYYELGLTTTSEGLSRDNTAQMAYNALDVKTIEAKYTQDRKTGDITETYDEAGTSVLAKYFGTKTFIGTFSSNEKTGSAEGTIDLINGGLEGATEFATAANIPYELDSSLLGEQVKVIYKEKSSTGANAVKPDKADEILGVFVTGATEVVWATRGDVANQKSASAKIVVDETTYNTINTVPVTVDYIGDAVDKAANNGNTTTNSTLTTFLMDGGAADKIKFILNTDGKVASAYVETLTATKVNSVTSTTITLNTVGSITLKGNEVEEGLKAGDVVVFTKFYNADATKATFTVEKAETASGKITGYKADESVTVDGTKYYYNDTLKELTTSALTDLAGEIGSEVTLYLLGGYVAAIEKTSTTAASNYAVVVAKTDTDSSATNLSSGRVKLLLTDNTSTEYVVSTSSTLQPTGLAIGDLVKFTESNGTVSISAKVTDVSNEKVWDADTKQVAAKGVAEVGAVLYVETKANTWKVYDIRTLRTIADDDKDVTYIANAGGKITIAKVSLLKVPAGATSDTVYGMITANNGQVSVSDTECTQYTVATLDGTKTINVKDSNGSLAAGDYVWFLESSDTIYAQLDVNEFATGDDVNGEAVKNVAVKEYSTADKVLSYYTALEIDPDGNYVGRAAALTSTALDKDVEIYYFNKNTNKAGDAVGVNAFDSTTGYANAKIFIDDGVITKIFVETSSKKDIDGNSGAEYKGKIGGVAAKQQYVVSVAGLSGTLNGLTYKITADASVVAAGDSVTYTLTISGTPTAAAAKDEFTFAVTGLTAAEKFTAVEGSSNKLTAANDAAKVTVADTPGDAAISGTYTIECASATAAPVVTITATAKE